MSETLLAHCPLCHDAVRVPVRSRQVARDGDGHPVVAFRATEVVHRCHRSQEIQ